MNQMRHQRTCHVLSGRASLQSATWILLWLVSPNALTRDTCGTQAVPCACQQMLIMWLLPV